MLRFKAIFAFVGSFCRFIFLAVFFYQIPCYVLLKRGTQQGIIMSEYEAGGETMKPETIARIRRFSQERDWDQFHTPANLAKSISIEANELLECFQWSDTEYDLEHVKEELADVIVYCQDMLDRLGLDVDEIVMSKMAKNEAKYPVEKRQGQCGEV